ncbi:MAG: aldose 1-epimerase family protein [Eubacteriales bacterium]|nr:aldose 1-epimerase family protein [Eubacteriales bacterium]
MNVFALENEKLAVQIADHGAELVSLYDKEAERELVWQADPAFWNRHAPVLFPNVGKYYTGAMLYKGEKYPMGQHGYARDAEFVRTEEGEASVTHVLVSDEESKKMYPFDFQLAITHELEGNSLTVKWSVKNTGKETMYFTIGGHPAFRVPVLPDTEFEDYFLKFDENVATLEYMLLDTATGTAISEKKWPMHIRNGLFRLRKDMFDKDALIFDGGQIQRAALALPDGTPYIELSGTDIPNFGIWSKPGAPYVCLEPWYGRCDNCGFEGEISEKPGVNALEPGNVFEKEYVITVK